MFFWQIFFYITYTITIPFHLLLNLLIVPRHRSYRPEILASDANASR